jgi:hypothetical protein
MLVAESVHCTAYVNIENLSEIIEGSIVNGIAQSVINSKTDIVLFGEMDREKDWIEGKKHFKILDQLNNTKRATPIRFIRFDDFMNLSLDINRAIKRGACVARFEGKRPPPPGIQRTRGVCFGYTLYSSSGLLNEKGKAASAGFFNFWYH